MVARFLRYIPSRRRTPPRIAAAAAAVERPPSSLLRSLLVGARRGVASAVVAFCVGNTLFTVVGYPACVSGGSMRPALNDSLAARAGSSQNGGASQQQDSSALSWLQLKVNWVFVNCWKAKNYDFKRGEIVVFVSPKGEENERTFI